MSSQTLSIPQAIQIALQHHQAGRLPEAENIYRQILLADPANTDALYLLGSLALQCGKYEMAVELIGKAIQADSTSPYYHNNLGVAYRNLGNLDQAVNCHEMALSLKPDFAESHHNLGLALKKLAKPDEAVSCFKTALRLIPDFAEALNDLGSTLRDQGKLEEALFFLRKAIAVSPAYADAYNNLGNALRDAGELVRSLEAFERALTLNPDCHDAHHNRAYALLLMGNLSSGWTEYEWRWNSLTVPVTTRPFHAPRWQGESLTGKTIIAWGEQGVGDHLLFANCLPDLIAAAGHCVVECDQRLVSLFRRSFPNAEILPLANPPVARAMAGDIDFQIPLGSLPRWLRPDLDSFPRHSGYLKPDPQRLAFWKQHLATLSDRPKVGISWRGWSRDVEHSLYYAALSRWSNILGVPGIDFVNLQYGDDCREELAAAREQSGATIHCLNDIDLTNDFDDTAALCAALDLIITPFSTVLHLAGAVGAPLWLMHPDSNWISCGTPGIPWFPSVRAYPKKWNAPWDALFHRVGEELGHFRPLPASTK